MNKTEFKVFPIGEVKRDDQEIRLQIADEFKDGLLKLDSFSHVIVIWWADKHDNEKDRNIVETDLPYVENTRAGE